MRDEILITTFTDFPLATAVRATKCCCLRGKQGVDPKADNTWDWGGDKR